MRNLLIIIGALLVVSCGQSYSERRRLSRMRNEQLRRQDSAALKVAVTPTIDCLPLFLAYEHRLFDTAVDIRLKYFTAQMDIDTAMERGRVEVGMTDIVRMIRMIDRGTPLEPLTATASSWQLLSPHNARVSKLSQMKEKMIGMTRYSATDLLSDYAVDSAGLESEWVFKIQVNSVNVRLKMFQNNELDAFFLPEPQATVARRQKGRVLMDTKNMDMRFGVMAVNTSLMKGKERERQIDAFLAGYKAACDSLNRYGAKRYKEIIMKKMMITAADVKALPRQTFPSPAPPREKDMDRARKWTGTISNKK